MRQAQKDAKKLAGAGLRDNAKAIIEIFSQNLWQNCRRMKN
jgi:hypothetical protein